MILATRSLKGLEGTTTWSGQIAVLAVVLLLAACGGGASTTDTTPPTAAQCDPSDPSTADQCGTVLVGITDADGDFVNYAVDVVQLSLEMANGRTVDALPASTRINFTDYVDMTEVLTAATVPPGTYVAGTITLDYADAEVYVEAGGAAKKAVVTDLGGVPLTQTDLKIVLPEQDRLVVTRGRPSLLQLDFDLAASHLVDIAPTPATAASEQFIVAEIVPVDEKDIRVRGPLVDVNEDESSYVVAIRPFHDRAGDFGRVTVHTTGDTEFEVDGEMFTGAEGLRALAAAGRGTPTVAAGTLNVAERKFTAHIVLAGSSVPGIDRDAVVGNVIARSGNFLTVRGATIIPSDRRAHFHDDVVVEIGPNTKVFKDGDRTSDLSIRAISVGQRVTIRGTQGGTPTTDANAPQILFDATEGAVRMHVTHLSGIVNAVMPGQTDITLHSIDRRRAQIFDFSGTGMTPAEDATIENYEIATGNLVLADFAAGKPIVAFGFPTAFGAAPPDFEGRTIIDYTDVRSALGVGWGAQGTLYPFLATGSDGLLLDNQNPDIDVRHYIKQGPVLIDLTALDSDTLIAPRATGRSLYYIKSQDSLRLYSNFNDFEADLSMSLDGATAARSMHARGHYNAETNVFTAYKIGIHLLEP
ncbi:MAG: metallophosphoesterase [Woeseiaceae bacterium]|nr:metallophosphoesterase [Woeseiaceae bacterium]